MTPPASPPFIPAPPQPKPTVDHDALGRLLRRLDADAEAAGWDQPPQLHIVYATGSEAAEFFTSLNGRYGTPATVGPYTSRQFIPSEMLCGDTPATLRQIALNFAYTPAHPAVGRLLSAARLPGVVAVAAIVEAHAIEVLAGQDRDRSRRIEHLPGAYEVRTVDCCGLDDVFVELFHRRGRPAELVSDVLPGGDGVGHLAHLGGFLITSVRLLAAAITGTAPARENITTRWPPNEEAERQSRTTPGMP